MENRNDGHRRSIRLVGYDYSAAGLYFITICTQNHVTILGEINDGIMMLSDAGKMAQHWIIEINNNIPDIRITDYIIMPNHVHFIIQICENGEITVGDIVRKYKTFSTNEYIRGVKNCGWKPFDKRVWQRNYYEHIIRDQNSYNTIAEYIQNNPTRWENDKLHKL